MLTLLNRILPESIKTKFKEPLRFFIQRSTEHYHTEIEQIYSILRLKNIIPAIPSLDLQFRVSGNRDGNFFWNGNRLVNNYQDALTTVGRSFDDFEKILDFGTGCGRVLIPLSFRVDPKKLHGTDIDQEAIDWFKGAYDISLTLTVTHIALKQSMPMVLSAS